MQRNQREKRSASEQRKQEQNGTIEPSDSVYTTSAAEKIKHTKKEGKNYQHQQNRWLRDKSRRYLILKLALSHRDWVIAIDQ